MNKTRIHVYLGANTKRVQKAAKKRGVPMSKYVQAAIIAFLDADQDKRDAATQRSLNRIIRLIGKIERDNIVAAEAMALFIQYELAIKPPVPVSDQDSAKAQGHERFVQFIKRVGQRLSKGKSLVSDIVDEISVTQDDFYQMDLEDDGDENEQK
ncbi:MAG: CopG family transcriptional regulator [Hyphomicrobiales bacterium]